MMERIRAHKHFNSHPHEEDDIAAIYYEDVVSGISTHILTRRMTLYVKQSLEDEYISTHILTRRMTDLYPYTWRNKVISTHILTRRMTAATWIGESHMTFQLTSSRGG